MSTIRGMTENELRTLVDWAGREGWNPGRNDADLFWRLDPEGFLALQIDGSLAGGGAIIRYDSQFGFMGLFLVDPAHRGRKLGTELWYARRDRLLARMEPGATIGLDAVDAMIPFYERGGFRAFYRHRRFEVPDLRETPAGGPEPVDLAQVPAPLLAEFDRRGFPADRSRFLDPWIRQPGATSLAVLDGDRLRGYGVLRPCLSGWKIGPLFAEDRDVAERLLRRFRQIAGAEPLTVDLPDNNPGAVSLSRDLRMREVFGCVRMYYGAAPEIRDSQVFGVATLEVG